MTKTIAYIDANNVLVSGFAIPDVESYHANFYKGFDVFSYLNALAGKRGWGEVTFKYFDSTLPAKFGREDKAGDDKLKNAENRIEYARANGSEIFLGKMELQRMRVFRGDEMLVGNKYVEKRTDAFMTTEIVADACINHSIRQLILTDDSDFVPAIYKARQFGAELILVSPPITAKENNTPNKALTGLFDADQIQVITPQDVQEHLMPATYRLRRGKSVLDLTGHLERDGAYLEILQQQSGTKPVKNAKDWRENAFKKGIPDLTRLR